MEGGEMSMGNFLYEKVLPLLEYVPYALLIGVCVALLITLIYALVRTAQKKPVARGVRESLWGYFFIFPWEDGHTRPAHRHGYFQHVVIDIFDAAGIAVIVTFYIELDPLANF